MKKSAKRNTIVSAILSTVFCVSLMTGATFALFTSKSEVNIAVTSGKVEVVATISDLSLYTPKEIATEEGNNITNDTNIATTNDNGLSGTFGLGGTATLEDGTLKLDKMAPGDKATFKINVTNYSNVNVKYRTKIAVDDCGLFEGLKVNIGGLMVQSSSIWKSLAAPATDDSAKVSSYDCYVELPTTAENTYQNKSCKIGYTVEAVQGNAATTDDAGASLGVATATATVASSNNVTTGSTTLASADSVAVSESETKSVASATVPEGAKLEEGANSLTLNVSETATSDFTVTLNDNQSSKTLEVEMKGLSNENNKPIKVVMYIGKALDGLTLYHNNDSMTKKDSATAVSSDKDYYYDQTSGFLTMATNSFSPFTYVFDAKVVSTVSEFVSAVNDETIKTIKLGEDITIDKNDYDVSKRLYVDRDGLTIDLNKKTLTSPNCALTITGDNVTIKNGTMVSANGGSYTMQIYAGINVLVDGITMTGGVNVSGKNSANSDPDATVTITNCNITGTNFYAVCAQDNSAVTIKNTTLTKGKGAFFWIEKKGYSEGDEASKVDSKISYEKSTVTFNNGDISQDGVLYNKVGVAPVAIEGEVK